MSKRDIKSRYRGSALGLGWTFAQPLLMLGVYTFVFSTIFQSRWGDGSSGGHIQFAINLFTGLIVFNLFGECTNNAPGLIIGHKNFVTKIVFPLEILGAASVLAGLFQAGISLIVLIGFELIATHAIPITILWLPYIWLPLVLACLSLTWILSAAGVYFRDLGQIIGVLTQMIMFLSAVFYPVNAFPESIKPIAELNPLVIVIEQTRAAAIRGETPDLFTTSALLVSSMIACEIALRMFKHAKRGFADVL